MTFPFTLFPKGFAAGLAKLVAVTSDQNRPEETYWQNIDGYVLRCQHDSKGNWWEDKSLGDATACNWWSVPQPNQIPS